MSGANGDTAKPAPRFSDDHYQKAETRKKQRRLMYVWGLDGTCIFDGDGYSEFAPYGRVIRDGCVIRIETDGNGGLVEYVESRPATFYGVRFENLRKPERPSTPKNKYPERNKARQKRLETVTAVVATYPDSTIRELCELTGFGYPTMTAYIRTLFETGVLDRDIPGHDRFGGKRPYTYRIKGAE